MLAQFVHGAASSALAFKLFLNAALIAALLALGDTDDEESAPAVVLAAVFMTIRDLLYAALARPSVVIAADAAFPAFVFLIFSARRNRRDVIIMGAVAAVAAAASAVAAELRPGLLASSLAVVPAILTVLMLLRPTVEEGDDTPLAPRVFAAVAAFLPAATLLAIPAISPLRNSLAYPASAALLVASVAARARYFRQEILKERDFLSDAMDTLYGFVLRASESMHGGADLDRLLDYVAKTLAEQTGADGSLVLMVDDFDDVVATRALHGTFPPITALPEDLPRESAYVDAWLRDLRIPLGEGFVGEIAQSGKASFVREVAQEPRIVIDATLPAGSLIAVPLLVGDRVIGEVLAVRGAGQAPFADEDFDVASLLADFASLVVNNAFSFQDAAERTDIDREASIAADIQKAMRPKRLPELPGLAFGVYANPARGVCSDYYDVIPARKNKLVVVMGDIAGKGVSASMIMVMIRAIVHLVVNTDRDAATMLNWINRGITGKIDIDHFATLQVVIYDRGDGSCEYANAGHRPPLVWRESTGLVDAIDDQNVPIGVEKTTTYGSDRFVLGAEDILVLYTDGVVETMNKNGRQYGMRSLTTLLHKHHALEAKEIAQKVASDLEAFSEGSRQHDDQTVLVMKTKAKN